jgi:hypothetical protein
MKTTHLLLMSFCISLASPVRARTVISEFDAAMLGLVQQYEKIHGLLAADSKSGFAKHTARLEALAKNLLKSSAKLTKRQRTISHQLKFSTARLRRAKGLALRREAFKVVSRPLVRWAIGFKPKAYQAVYCSMAKGSWLQSTGKVRNPYYGRKMLNCGKVLRSESALQKTILDETRPQAPCAAPRMR